MIVLAGKCAANGGHKGNDGSVGGLHPKKSRMVRVGISVGVEKFFGLTVERCLIPGLFPSRSLFLTSCAAVFFCCLDMNKERKSIPHKAWETQDRLLVKVGERNGIKAAGSGSQSNT